jgi:hypothetical protein
VKLLKVKNMVHGVMAILLATTLAACGGKGGINTKIDGIIGPDVEVAGGNLLVSMVFTNLQIDGGATIPIPKYPNSSLQIGPDFQSNGTLLVLTVGLPDYKNNLGQGLDPQSLPGGRPLPAVASGVMPAMALQIKQLMNTVLYVGPQVIGFFVPFKALNSLNGAILSFRYYNKTGEPVGNMSLVGADTQGQNAGILLMMRADLMGIIGKPSNSTLRQLAQLI